MERTAEVIFDQGHQVLHLPEDIHLRSDRVLVRQDENTGDVTLSPVAAPKIGGDFENLFKLLDELGPAPDEFMLNICDPLLEAEDIFGPEDSW